MGFLADLLGGGDDLGLERKLENQLISSTRSAARRPTGGTLGGKIRKGVGTAAELLAIGFTDAGLRSFLQEQLSRRAEGRKAQRGRETEKRESILGSLADTGATPQETSDVGSFLGRRGIRQGELQSALTPDVAGTPIQGRSIAEALGITEPQAEGVRRGVSAEKALGRRIDPSAGRAGRRARSFNLRSVVQGIMTNRNKFNIITGKVLGALPEDISAAILEGERTKLDAGAGRLNARDFETLKGMFAGLTQKVWAEGAALADAAEDRITLEEAANRAKRR